MLNKSWAVFYQRIIRGGFLLLFFLMPLIFTPYNYELFEYNKMMLVYGLTVVITASFLIKGLIKGKIVIQKTPFDIPLMLFLVSQILSTIFSIDRHTSLFGYYSRFHGGLFSTLAYLFLFYIFISEFKNETGFVYKSLFVSFASGFLVSLYGILQRLGIDKHIWVQDVQNRVFSSLGQPNWLSAYLAILAIILLSLFLQEKRRRKLIFLGLSLIFYIVMIFTKSRSGFGGFYFGLVFTFFLALAIVRTGAIFKKIAVVFFLLFLTSFIFGVPFYEIHLYTLPGLQNRLKSQQAGTTSEVSPTPTDSATSTIEYGGTESGKIRSIVWKGAIEIVKHYPILGTGVETFAYSYYQFRPQEHNLTSEWDFLYNKAHNEYLNFAANSGIFGLATYLLVIFAFVVVGFKAIFQKKGDFLVLAGLLGAYFSILFSNFFGFSVVIIGVFFFLLPSFSLILANYQKKAWEINLPSFIPAVLVLLSVAFYLLVILVKMWRADTYFNLGNQYQKASQYIQSYSYLQKAIALNPNEPFFQEELAESAAVLSVIAAREKETELSNKLKNEALILSEKLVDNYPKNVNFFKTRTKVLYILSELDENLLNATLETILKAWQLAPNDPKIAYNVGLMQAKVGKTQEAIETLKKSAELKPDYHEPRWALALFYEQLGEKEKAIAELNFILNRIRPDDKLAKDKLEELSK